jgi:cytochrome c-type biogenesis protein CcmH/NrfF
MNDTPKAKKTITLWKLLLAIIVIGIFLAWILSRHITMP